jgi:hypothetical protein
MGESAPGARESTRLRGESEEVSERQPRLGGRNPRRGGVELFEPGDRERSDVLHERFLPELLRDRGVDVHVVEEQRALVAREQPRLQGREPLDTPQTQESPAGAERLGRRVPEPPAPVQVQLPGMPGEMPTPGRPVSAVAGRRNSPTSSLARAASRWRISLMWCRSEAPFAAFVMAVTLRHRVGQPDQARLHRCVRDRAAVRTPGRRHPREAAVTTTVLLVGVFAAPSARHRCRLEPMILRTAATLHPRRSCPTQADGPRREPGDSGSRPEPAFHAEAVSPNRPVSRRSRSGLG